MAENVAFKLNLDAGDAPKTLADLEKRVQDVNEELSKTEIGTKQYEDLRRELVRNNKELKNLELGYEALDVEQQASELGSVAGAVGDVTSAFVLLGGESETMEQIAASIQTALGVSMAFKGAIEGVQSARKLLNSLDKESLIFKIKDAIATKASAAAQGLYTAVVGTSTGALKAFRIALASTGIGLIVVGLGLLISNFEKVSNWVKDTIKSFAGLSDTILLLLGPIGWLILAYEALFGEIEDGENKAMTANEKRQKENAKAHKERIKQIEEERDALIKASNDKISALETELEIIEASGEESSKISKQILKEELAKTQAVLDANQKKIQSWIDYYKLQAELSGQSEEQFIESMKSRGVDLERLNNEAQELLKKNEDAVRLAEARITGLEKKEREKRSQEADKLRQEQEKKDQEALNARTKRIQEETKALMDFYDKVEAIENEYNNRFISEQDQQENAVRDKYFALIAEAEKYGEDIAILEAAREAELLDIRNDFRQQELEAQQALKDQEAQNIQDRIAEEQALNESKIEFAQQSLNSLNAINDLAFGAEIERIKAKEQAGEKLSANERKRLKRDEQIRKAFAVAQVAIDTASAISSAIAGATAAAAATGPGAVVATPLFIVSQIATVLGAFAQVASILRAPSPSIGNISGGGEIDAPDTEGAAQDAPDNNQFDSGSTFLDIPQKVYVLEQDITNTQDTVANIKQQATFG